MPPGNPATGETNGTCGGSIAASCCSEWNLPIATIRASRSFEHACNDPSAHRSSASAIACAAMRVALGGIRTLEAILFCGTSLRASDHSLRSLVSHEGLCRCVVDLAAGHCGGRRVDHPASTGRLMAGSSLKRATRSGRVGPPIHRLVRAGWRAGGARCRPRRGRCRPPRSFERLLMSNCRADRDIWSKKLYRKFNALRYSTMGDDTEASGLSPAIGKHRPEIEFVVSWPV